MSSSDFCDGCSDSEQEEVGTIEATDGTGTSSRGCSDAAGEEACEGSADSPLELPSESDDSDAFRQATRLVKAFAHQIRNPLTYSVASLDFLREELDLSEPLTAESYDALELGMLRLRETLGEVELLVANAPEATSPIAVEELIGEVCQALPYRIDTRSRFDASAAMKEDRGRTAQCLFNILASHAQTSPDYTAHFEAERDGAVGRCRVTGGDPREEVSMRIDFLSVIRGEEVHGSDRLSLIREFADSIGATYTFSERRGNARSVLELPLTGDPRDPASSPELPDV